MPSVSLHTLGCKLNFAETGSLARGFEDRGFELAVHGEAVDVAVINTCTVTAEAERKCRQSIRKVLRANPDAFVAVTGCYAQLRPEEIAEIPGVDLVLGATEKFDLFRYIRAFTKQEQTQVHVSCIDDVRDFGPAHAAGQRTRAFLKVQDGCDYTCAFCTIPRARGRSRSHTIEGAVRQAQEIAASGFQEIILSGVNIGLFGQDTGESLPGLLAALDAVDGIERYRISSIEPNLLTDEIIDLVAGSDRFQPHFHLPLQSGDDHVLGAMRRRYRAQAYVDRVSRVREVLPHACIGADVIVGFPAETESRFQNSVAFLENLPVDYLHVFTYSERPGTVAVEQPERVDGAPVDRHERSRRNRVLRLLSEKKRADQERRFMGTVRPVLWERGDDSEWMDGWTDNYIRVRMERRPAVVARVEEVLLDRRAGGHVEGALPELRLS